MWVLSQATQCLNKTWINIKIIVECANIEAEEQDTNQEEQVSKTCDNKKPSCWHVLQYALDNRIQSTDMNIHLPTPRRDTSGKY